MHWRANDVHCKLQKETRTVIPFDLHHKLRRPPVDMHENGLLGQRRPEILRLLKQWASPHLFWRLSYPSKMRHFWLITAAVL